MARYRCFVGRLIAVRLMLGAWPAAWSRHPRSQRRDRVFSETWI